MSTIDSIIQETVSNVSNKTIDAIMEMVVNTKSDFGSDRANDYEVGADDAVNDIIRKLHIFKLKMNEPKS
jgi:hypothetical protein